MRLPFFLLLLLSSSIAHVAIYVKGYSSSKYTLYDGDTVLQGKDYHFFVSALKEWGYDNIVPTESIDTSGEAIIILGCTDSLSKDEIETLKKYVYDGGGLILDLFCKSNDELAREFGILIGDKYKGVATATWVTDYIEVYNGYYIGSPIVGTKGPIRGYEKMFYVGYAVKSVSNNFYPAFSTDSGQIVALWGYYGKGRIFATGCFLCGDQMLITNAIDWVQDGKIDFPHFFIGRRILPLEDSTYNVRDEITVGLTDAGMHASVIYPYSMKGDFCKQTPSTKFERDGGTLKIISDYAIQESCFLQPFLVKVEWTAPDGKTYLREVYMKKEQIHVEKMAVFSAEPVPLALLGIMGFLLILILIAIKRERSKMWIRRRLKMLEEKESILNKEYMMRKIDEETYKSILKEYIKEREDLLAKLRSYESKPYKHTNKKRTKKK